MELDASLKLLDLNPNAAIEEAEQAYMRMQRRIEQYYQNANGADLDAREADLDLLSRAYERARGYISGKAEKPKSKPNLRLIRDAHMSDPFEMASLTPEMSPTASEPATLPSDLPESGIQTVEAALAVISKRLHEAEAGLSEAQLMVDTAAAAVDTTNRHHERIRQEGINAIVVAKSARIRALLLEIEVKRAMEKAAVIAEKAKKRVEAAKQMAMDATVEADKAQEHVRQLKKSEEVAAAEAVHAEKQLELARTRLKSLTHGLVETRSRMKLSQGIFCSDVDAKAGLNDVDTLLSDPWSLLDSGDARFSDERKILADFWNTDVSFQDVLSRKKDSLGVPPENAFSAPHTPERRGAARVLYPLQARPMFFMGSRTFSVMDLSGNGMRLEIPDQWSTLSDSRLVRGLLHLPNRTPVKITGKVVRECDGAIGLRLVTHIGKYILEDENRRLIA